METLLQQHLVRLATLFAESRQLKLSTVGKLAASDGRFFTSIQRGKTFTARKHDAVVVWFSAHWPDDLEWPTDIERPSSAPTAAPASGSISSLEPEALSSIEVAT